VYLCFGDSLPGALWPATGLADQYWRLMPFRTFSGRTDVEAEAREVIFILVAMAADAHRRAFVKDGRCKRGV
jgi:hypothetical protein